MAIEDLTRVSDGLAALVAGARGLVVGLRAEGGRAGSGVLWRGGVVVTSEQALPEADTYSALLPGGGEATVRLAGRDRGTNVAVLRTEAEAPAPSWTGADPIGPGALAVALGTDGTGSCTARLAMLHYVGPEWQSMAGGRIDRRLVLDARLSGAEEGGPVLDARGGLLGISTLGPRRRALVIPHATVERVLAPLLAEGKVPRGWLGLALQPVALPEALRGATGHASGLMAVALNPDGPALQAGLLPGDILLELDSVPVGSPRSLAGALGPERVGSACTLRLLRGGVTQEVQMTVGTRP